jgi:hypothetical protein
MDGATARRLGGLVSAGALVLLLVGCAGAAPPAQQPAPPSPRPSAAAQTTVPQAAPTGTTLLWPVTDIAAAQDLQTKVDGGAQPWTLDPEEVAVSYATSTYGWTDPEPTTTAPGSVDLTNPSGGTAHVTLVQPVRAGSTGIWVVSAATRT